MSKTETLTRKKINTITIKDKQYNVVFLNDDKTPFEFVVALIQMVFKKTYEDAFRLTMEVHTNGSAVVETYKNKDIAQTKADYCVSLARTNGFPLRVEVVKEL